MSNPPYTKQLFDNHVRLFNSPGSADQRFETLVPKLKALFVAAGRKIRGSKNPLPASEISLLEWMAKANSEFKLQVDLDE